MSLAGIIAGLQINIIWAITGITVAFGVIPLLIGLNRALYQLKAPPELLGRIFAFRLAIGTLAQTIGVLFSGLIAENIFKPIVGQTYAPAITLSIISSLFLVATLISVTLRPLRQLEQRLPDYDNSKGQSFET